MPTDLTMICPGVRGTIAAACEALGEAGINIDGACGFGCEGEGILHVLASEPDAARRTIEALGLEVREERDVILVEADDRPGVMGELLRRIADAEVGLKLLYFTADGRLVIGADDLERARAAIAGHASASVATPS